MTYAIFLLPSEDFQKEIYYWKNKIIKSEIDSAYTAHPPHLTIYHFSTSNIEKCVQQIVSLKLIHNEFDILIKKKDVFWDDRLTLGHTLYYQPEKNDYLYDLQLVLANKLKDYVLKSVDMENQLKDDKFLNSYRRYGFPFVGSHWIPHFSIGSLRVKKEHTIFEDFLSQKNHFNFKISKFSLWEIEGDMHKKLIEFSL
ncbi:2'-5' RNA ligase family protein [Candidatus Marinimicrobia bacterium]|nr:2'-5' RNA ligase family protein [Candidatus Neomarinimicrobiota bacterium]